MLTFDEYMTKNKIPNVAAASAMECTTQAIHNYRIGSKMPKPSMVEKIRIFTDGVVLAEDLHKSHWEWRKANGKV